MAKVFVWCFLASLVVFAAAELEDLNIKLDNKPGLCVVRGLEIPEGQTKPGKPGYCVNITCKDASKGLDGIDLEVCEVFQVPEGCKLQDPDLTKQFPDCCAKKICP